jgi:hypothetical protein
MKRFGALLVSATAVTAASVNPITRVAELLEGLSKKVETDGKAEAKLFTAYKCWATKTISEKTASNEEGAARIETLTTFIDDIQNGRIEFTSERVEREKELAAIVESIEKAKALREQEAKDFAAAKDEMDKAITALEGAVSILNEGAPVSLLSKRFEQRTALELARAQLSTADYQFLEKALDVPTKDWNKLNKKATFKAKYGARSGEIQTTLKNMLKTFQDNLSAATKKEDDAKATYKKLKQSKETEKEEAETALIDLKDEGGARGMNLQEAKAEKAELEEQITNDKKYIGQTEQALADKKAEFKERKRLRAEEVASISEAIGILRSDDARDLFKKSFESQGYFFLQTSASNKNMNQALETVYAAYQRAGASQKTLASVTSRMSAKAVEGVAEVITMIDVMLGELETEAQDDLDWKEECETFTMENQKEALKHSREMDDQTALIERKVARMEELTEKIRVANEEIKATQEQMKEATDVREKENTEYKKAKADDSAAVELIQMAMDALTKFYKDNNLSLIQEPGKAPTPPPTTFEGEYGGEKDEHQGVVGILTLIKEDVEKDIATADAEEEASLKAFEAFIEESNGKIDNLNKQIETFDKAHADAETKKSEAEVAHEEAQGLLTSVLDALKAKKSDCDFIAVNFPIRKDNRQQEVDGLKKAKTILEGGEA